MMNLEQQIKQLDEKLDTHTRVDEAFYNRFEEHMRIYANNGKELKRVGDLIAKHIEDSTPMLNTFRGATLSWTVFKWILALIATVAGIALAVKNLFN